MLSDCHTFKDPGDLLRGEPSGAPADERQKLSIEVKKPAGPARSVELPFSSRTALNAASS
jgi:hypothetical protein